MFLNGRMINKMESLAIQRDEVWLHATTWMDLEHLTPSERSGHKRAHLCLLDKSHLQNRQIHRDRKETSGFLGLEGGGMGLGDVRLMSKGFGGW